MASPSVFSRSQQILENGLRDATKDAIGSQREVVERLYSCPQRAKLVRSSGFQELQFGVIHTPARPLHRFLCSRQPREQGLEIIGARQLRSSDLEIHLSEGIGCEVGVGFGKESTLRRVQRKPAVVRQVREPTKLRFL